MKNPLSLRDFVYFEFVLRMSLITISGSYSTIFWINSSFACSTCELPFMSTPCFVADVIDETIPIGVDIRNAHGHDITIIDNAL